jgi:hypothetical protein
MAPLGACSVPAQLGTPTSDFYPTDQSVYSKASYYHNFISHSELLPQSLQSFGDMRLLSDYKNACDEVTVLSKLSKICKLSEAVTQNHPQKYATILSALYDIIGFEDDIPSACTISGYFNALISTIHNVRPDIDVIALAITGSNRSFSLDQGLLGALNVAIYTLSVKPIVDDELLALDYKIRQWVIPPETEALVAGNLKYLTHVVDTLKNISPYLESTDLATIRAAIGSASDIGADISLFGCVNQIAELIADAPADLDDQLVDLLGGPPPLNVASASSLYGRLSATLAPVHEKLIYVLKNNKLQDAITPFFLQYASRTDIDALHSLIERLNDVCTDLCLADTTADATDDFFVANFEPASTIATLMNIYKLAFDMFSCGQSYTPFWNHIGPRFPLLGQNTLSSLVAEVVDAFYLYPIRQRLKNEVNQDVANFWDYIISLGDSFSALKKAPLFGNYQLVDLDHPNTLCVKIALLQGALVGSFSTMNHSTATYIANAIGLSAVQPDSIWGGMHALLSESEQSVMEQSLHSLKEIVDEVLVRIHQDFFSYYFKVIDADLKLASTVYGVLSYQCGLATAVQNLKISELVNFFNDDSYTFLPSAIIDIYGILGTLQGRSSQKRLAGNVLFIASTLIRDKNFLEQHVGKPSDIKASPGSSTFNSLYGNINWLHIQLSQNKICSCVRTGAMLAELAREIDLCASGIDMLGRRIGDVIVQHPTTDFAEQALHGLTNSFSAVKTQLQSIYSLKKELPPKEGSASEGEANEGGANEGSASEGEVNEGGANEGGTSEGEANEGEASAPPPADVPCLAYKLWPSLQGMYNVFHALINQIQTLLPGEYVAIREHLPSETTPEYFYQSLDTTTSSVQKLVDAAYVLCDSMTHTPFFPVPDNASSCIESITNDVKDMYEIFLDINATGTLANHANEDKSDTYENFANSLHQLTEYSLSLGGLEPLYNSQTSFLVSNIARLLSKINAAVDVVFSDEELDVNVFIHNRQIDQYISSFARMGKCIVCELVPAMKPMRWLRKKKRQNTIDMCENARTENMLKRITHTLYRGATLWQKFAQNVLHQTLLTPQKYAYTSDEHRDVLFEPIISAIQGLSSVIQDKMVAAVRRSPALSYDPTLVEALRDMAVSVAQIKESAPSTSVYQAALQADAGMEGSFAETFGTLAGNFALLITELSQARCCWWLDELLQQIKNSWSDSTTLFKKLIGTMLECPLIEQSTQESLQMHFSNIGAKLCQIAQVVNALSVKIESLHPDLTKTLCMTTEVQPEVNATYEAIDALREAFAEAILTVVSAMDEGEAPGGEAPEEAPGIGAQQGETPPEEGFAGEVPPNEVPPGEVPPGEGSPNEIIQNTRTRSVNELFEIAMLTGRWGEKLKRVPLVLRNKIPQWNQSANASAQIVPAFCAPLINVDAINDIEKFLTNSAHYFRLVPFFSSVFKSLNKLHSVLHVMDTSGTHFCSTGGKHFAPPVMFLCQNVHQIVNAIQLTAELFEPIKANRFASIFEYAMVNLDTNWLIGDSDSVFYRHTAIPRLFIMRTAPSSLSFAFTHGGNEVTWSATGVINEPQPLSGLSIKDFAPITLFEVIQQDIHMLEYIYDTGVYVGRCVLWPV